MFSRRSWRSRAVVALAAAVVGGACASPDRFIDPGDAGGDVPVCRAGEYVCASARVARACDGRGGFGADVDCAPMGRTCFAGIGCRVCRPGESRCDPVRPNQTQVCNPDGLGWTDGASCAGTPTMTCVAGACEDRCRPAAVSYLGCEYWPVTLANASLAREGFPFAIAVANPQEYAVNLTVSGGELGEPIRRVLMPGAVQTVELPWIDELAQRGQFDSSFGGHHATANSVLRRGGAYHVETDGPVAVYQFNPLTYENPDGTGPGRYSYSNDASMLLPTRALTGNYVALTYPNQIIGGLPAFGGVLFGGTIAIVGVDPDESGTTVNVRMSAQMRDPANPLGAIGPGVRQYNLRQGDVLELQGATGGQDVSGSVIQANRPVAVYVGNDCVDVPDHRQACDHVEEQLLPNETWGRRYAVSPFRDRDAAYRLRVLSLRANNQLTFDGMIAPTECSAPLGAGQFCEFESNAAFQVSGTEPFLVVQYMYSQGDPDPACGFPDHPQDLPQCMGDPASVTEIPVDQFRLSYDFLVPDTYVRSFLNVVAPDGARIRLDGTVIEGAGEPVGTGYRLYPMQVQPGAHHIEALGGDGARFGIKVYGVAPYTSYAYPGGLDLAHISPPG